MSKKALLLPTALLLWCGLSAFYSGSESISSPTSDSVFSSEEVSSISSSDVAGSSFSGEASSSGTETSEASSVFSSEGESSAVSYTLTSDVSSIDIGSATTDYFDNIKKATEDYINTTFIPWLSSVGVMSLLATAFSYYFTYGNHKTIKELKAKAEEINKSSEGNIAKANEYAEMMKRYYEENKAQAEETAKALQEKLTSLESDVKELSDTVLSSEAKNKILLDIEQMFQIMATSSKEMVSNGTASKVTALLKETEETISAAAKDTDKEAK